MSKPYVVIDYEGNIAKAFQLLGPTILNTIVGEAVGNEGDWMITLADGGVLLLSYEQLISKFTLQEVDDDH
jgi:hypothetical protein